MTPSYDVSRCFSTFLSTFHFRSRPTFRGDDLEACGDQPRFAAEGER